MTLPQAHVMVVSSYVGCKFSCIVCHLFQQLQTSAVGTGRVLVTCNKALPSNINTSLFKNQVLFKNIFNFIVQTIKLLDFETDELKHFRNYLFTRLCRKIHRSYIKRRFTARFSAAVHSVCRSGECYKHACCKFGV